MMDRDLETLQSEIDAAREAYRAERELLVKTAGWIYADGPSAADAIEGLAEELGPGKVAEQFLVMPTVFGDLGATASDQLVADTFDILEPNLERLLEAQDRLDTLTRQREDVLAEREPGRLRVLNIGGREFVVDPAQNEVRSVEDGGERFALSGADAPWRVLDGAAPSLTEQFAQETGAEKAQPRAERDRTRGR